MAVNEAPALTTLWSSRFCPLAALQRIPLPPPQRGRRVDERGRGDGLIRAALGLRRELDRPTDVRPTSPRAGARTALALAAFCPSERPVPSCRSAPDKRSHRAPWSLPAAQRSQQRPRQYRRRAWPRRRRRRQRRRGGWWRKQRLGRCGRWTAWAARRVARGGGAVLGRVWRAAGAAERAPLLAGWSEAMARVVPRPGEGRVVALGAAERPFRPL